MKYLLGCIFLVLFTLACTTRTYGGSLVSSVSSTNIYQIAETGGSIYQLEIGKDTCYVFYDFYKGGISCVR